MWNEVDNRKLGSLSSVQRMLVAAQNRQPRFFPELNAEALLVASDYGGEHAQARYSVYSFLVTSVTEWKTWDRSRRVIRDRSGLERRISFSRLGDSKRSEVLRPFLASIDEIEGLSFTLLVDKRLAAPVSSDDAAIGLTLWKPRVRDKVARVVGIVALLVAGLSHRDQDVLWISDEDAIAANAKQLTALTKLLAKATSNASRHDLGHLRCGTAASDPGDLQLEDLVAIPDLVAGALSEVLSLTRLSESTHIYVPTHHHVSHKARFLAQWLADQRRPLRRLVCLVEPAADLIHTRTRTVELSL